MVGKVLAAIWLGGATVFGIPIWVIFALIALFFIIGFWVPQISKPVPKGLYVFLTLIFVFLAIFSSPFANIPESERVPQTTIIAEPTEYTIVVNGGTDTATEVSYDESAHKFTIAVGYDETGDQIVTAGNSTWTAPVLNFTIIAMPTTVASSDKVVPVTATVTVPSITSGTQTYYLLTKDSSGKYNALWSTQNGINNRETVSFTVPFSQSRYVTLTLTLNPDAIEAMNLYQSKDMTVTVGGQMFTVSIMKVAVFS